MKDSVNVLTRAMQANIRMMYKQRLFTENVQTLVDGYHHAQQGRVTISG